MAETLGSLCDKLTIVKLKQWHAENDAKLRSLAIQQNQLEDEIDQFIDDAASGAIPIQRLTFAANKVYRAAGNNIEAVKGSIGQVVSRLATVNCELWHEQEKVYEFEKVPAEDKNIVVKRLAHLNLERTQCIDEIDSAFSETIASTTGQNDSHIGGNKCI